MTLRKLPEAKALAAPQGYSWDVPSDALARWTEFSADAGKSDANTITIYDVIGEDMWTGGGFTAQRMNAALRSIGNADVTVKINSPGGSVFEGLTIYNQLVQHQGKVTIEVMGIAASAASIIAMAGDQINMGLGTFIMIHNAWGVVIGNRHDLTDAAQTLGQIDAAMTDIYEARTGQKRADITALMDAETFLTAKDAVAKGFADAVTEAPKNEGGASARLRPEIAAKRQLDALLAQQGVPRSERRRMLEAAAGGMRDAVPTDMRDAVVDQAAVARLIETIRS